MQTDNQDRPNGAGGATLVGDPATDRASLPQALVTGLAAGQAAGSWLADAERTIGYDIMMQEVAAMSDRLTALAGGMRPPPPLCLELGADIGSVVLLLAALRTGASVALLNAGDSAGCPPFAQLVTGTNEPVLRPATAQSAAAPGQVLLRTSGSTGRGKWTVHDRERLMANAGACVGRFGLGTDDRVLIPVPISHMFGLGAALLPALLAGASVVLAARGNPLGVLGAERAHDPTRAYFVPSQCRALLALRRGKAGYRSVVVAGDRLNAREAAAFEALHGPVLILYGSTELGAIAVSGPSDPPAQRHAMAGPLMPGVRLAGPVPDAAGAPEQQLFLHHAAGFLGYADDSGRIAIPAPDPVSPEDFVRIHPGPLIEVLGRADHAIKRDGLMVHLADIETCLSDLPQVSRAVAVATGETRRGAGLVAFVTLQRGTGDADDIETVLRRQCAAVLPGHAVPDRFVVLADLPLLASGKVDRVALGALAPDPSDL